MRFLAKHSCILLLALTSSSVVSNSCTNTVKKKDKLASKEVKPPPPPSNDKNISYLSVDTLQSFVKSVLTFTIPGKFKAPFDKLVFDKVIAYDFNGSEEPYPGIFDRQNQFIPIVEKQRALSIPQTKELIDLLTSTTTYGEVTAACFDPHLAFVFYNVEHPVLIVNICLDCNYLIASEKIPATEFNKINKGTESEYSAEGFSRKGKERIKRLGKLLDFYYGHIE